MRATLQTAAGNPENQDRAAIIESRAGLVLVVADGAGGQSGGAEAASMAVELVRRHAHELCDASSCRNLIETIDQAIAEDAVAGETTCAVAVITTSQVSGASVGDSGVWLIGQTEFVDMTRNQVRKPFAGSGTACVVPFEHAKTGNRCLLLATDGLLKYTSSDRILVTCRDLSDSADTVQRLIELVRYPSGALPDDATVILARL